MPREYKPTRKSRGWVFESFKRSIEKLSGKSVSDRFVETWIAANAHVRAVCRLYEADPAWQKAQAKVVAAAKARTPGSGEALVAAVDERCRIEAKAHKAYVASLPQRKRAARAWWKELPKAAQ